MMIPPYIAEIVRENEVLRQRLAAAETLLREAVDYRRKRELPDREWLDQAQAALEGKS